MFLDWLTREDGDTPHLNPLPQGERRGLRAYFARTQRPFTPILCSELQFGVRGVSRLPPRREEESAVAKAMADEEDLETCVFAKRTPQLSICV